MNPEDENENLKNFQRNTKFFMSFNRRKRHSPPIFYLQRSQSTKEVRSRRYSNSSLKIAENENNGENRPTNRASIFRQFALKRTRTWGSLVAHLNRSFRGGHFQNEAVTSAASNRGLNSNGGSGKIASTFYTQWRRSQSCRNIERLFSSRR